MPNNYTVSTSSTLENVGDNVASGTIPSSVDLFITPDANFVIQASDFGIGNSLPAEITSVIFTDTVAALDPSNKVKATATLAGWYTMPAANASINIDIDGSVKRFAPELSFTASTTAVSNVTQSYTVGTGGTNSAATSGGITTNTSSIKIEKNTQLTVATIRITAAENYHFTTVPSFTITSADANNWSSAITAEDYNTDNQLDDITYEFYYTIGKDKIHSTSIESIVVNAPVVTANVTTYTHLSSVYYEGYRNGSTIPSTANQTLTLNVVGSGGSTYDLKVEDTNGLTYDFTTETFTRSLTVLNDQTIQSTQNQFAKELDRGRLTYSITLPSKGRESTYSNQFITTVTPSRETKSDPLGVAANPFVVTLNQFGDVDYTVGIIAGTNGTNVGTTTIKSILNRKPFANLSSFVPTSFPRRSTHANGYFTTSQILGYTVNGTVSSHSHASRDVVLTATHASLKLQAGDTVTGTGVDAGAIIESFPGASTIRMDKTSTGTISGTLTFQRTVGISRQPVRTDITYTSPFTHDSLAQQLRYNVISSISDSNTAKLSGSTDFSDLTAGMLVQGNEIIGYPTITSISTTGDIVLSSNQTLSAGSALEFSVAGSELYISNLSVTGAGTSACTLNMSGYVGKMGNQDVVASLNLANFVTTYAAPVPAAATATCPLGGSVVITPLDGVTRHTESILIKNVTHASGDTGTAAVSADEQEILYVAPATGTSETLTYKVNDGVSLSASTANIVITFTP